MPTALPASLHHPLLWQGRRRSLRLPVIPSGLERLDTLLPGRGWPLGALSELLVTREGIGELSLLLPMLSRVSREGGWMVLVDPPWLPYAPAMHGHGIDLQRLLLVQTRDAQESLWACEQALRGVRGGVVLSWLQGPRHRAGFAHLRRLQLAARSGQKGAFLFRDRDVASQATPAALRLHLDTRDRELEVTLLKGRGARPGRSILLRRQHVEPAGRPLPGADAIGKPGNRGRQPGRGSERESTPVTPHRAGHA